MKQNNQKIRKKLMKNKQNIEPFTLSLCQKWLNRYKHFPETEWITLLPVIIYLVLDSLIYSFTKGIFQKSLLYTYVILQPNGDILIYFVHILTCWNWGYSLLFCSHFNLLKLGIFSFTSSHMSSCYQPGYSHLLCSHLHLPPKVDVLIYLSI